MWANLPPPSSLARFDNIKSKGMIWWIIGPEESIEWTQSGEGLKISTPFKTSNKSALVFKIDINDLGLIVFEVRVVVMALITVDG